MSFSGYDASDTFTPSSNYLKIIQTKFSVYGRVVQVCEQKGTFDYFKLN